MLLTSGRLFETNALVGSSSRPVKMLESFFCTGTETDGSHAFSYNDIYYLVVMRVMKSS